MDAVFRKNFFVDKFQHPSFKIRRIMENKTNYAPVKEFYAGKSVFVTGATGFLGKVLVEKLLWSCPGIENIYLLIRPVKQQDVTERLQEVLHSPVFDRIRQVRQIDLQKIAPIEGELTRPLLGINERDRNLLSNKISIMFHSAAVTRFDSDIKTAVDINMIGTKNVIDFSHQLSNLEALVHISTAYSNCDRQEVKEKVYPLIYDPEKVIELVQTADDYTMEKITPKMLENRPNTYTFTKALAENMLLRERGKVPIAIVRPSIVLSAVRDPVPGWMENWNGPTAVLIPIAKGVLRTLLCYENMTADLIPVDMVANLVICVGWITARNKSPDNFKVYNCSSGEQNPITWRKFMDYYFDNLRRKPLQNVLFYPQIFFNAQTVIHILFTLVLETLPAYILDFSYQLTGRQPKFVLLHEKLKKTKGALLFFGTHQWRFRDANVRALNCLLTDEDRRAFPFDVTAIEWRSYVNSYYDGIRRFLLKEA